MSDGGTEDEEEEVEDEEEEEEDEEEICFSIVLPCVSQPFSSTLWAASGSSHGHCHVNCEAVAPLVRKGQGPLVGRWMALERQHGEG